MKKYYIIRSDGSSLFKQGYDREFIFHCLIKLLDRTDARFQLLEIDENCKFASVQLDSALVAADGAANPLIAEMNPFAPLTIVIAIRPSP